jgi:hypothetical protein
MSFVPANLTGRSHSNKPVRLPDGVSRLRRIVQEVTPSSPEPALPRLYGRRIARLCGAM